LLEYCGCGLFPLTRRGRCPVTTIPTGRAAGGPAADGSGKITREAVLAAALQTIDRDGAEASYPVVTCP